MERREGRGKGEVPPVELFRLVIIGQSGARVDSRQRSGGQALSRMEVKVDRRGRMIVEWEVGERSMRD